MSTAADLNITKVGVVGLGLMGHGIAQTAASKGFQVVAVESNQAAVDRGIGMIKSSLDVIAKKAVTKEGVAEAVAKAQSEAVLARISTSTDKKALKDCDIVVEAIIENLEIKKAFYSELGAICKPATIFASNTSSFEIGFMSDASGRPGKMVGMHFFNPVQLMKLVEVVKTAGTSEDTFSRTLAFGRALGKEAVACKDTPGFVVNRLLVPYLVQAVAMLERGEASVKDIDAAMKYGAGHPMGPFTLIDFTGVDTILYVMQGWSKNYPTEPAFFVPKLLEDMVAKGHLGRKTGQGFYKWAGNKVVE